jgi:hypothetical protein
MTTGESRAIYGAILLVWFLAPTTSVGVADTVTLHLSYTEVHDRILPFAERTATAVNLTVQLQTDGKAHERGTGDCQIRHGDRRFLLDTIISIQ